LNSAINFAYYKYILEHSFIVHNYMHNKREIIDKRGTGMKKQKSFTQRIMSKLHLLVTICLFLAVSLYSSASPALAGRPSRPPKSFTLIPSLSKSILLQVRQDGMYRVSYEELQTVGLDLKGMRSTEIALTNRGVPVPIYLSNERFFGPGDYFDFYGQALDTLYTDTNVYQIQLNRNLAARIQTAPAAPNAEAPQSFYLEEIINQDNRAYDVGSPTGDPWYHSRMQVSNNNAQQWDFPIQLDDYVPGVAPVSISLEAFGATSFPANPDHHLQIKLNSQMVADQTFDGADLLSMAVDNLPVIPGANTLSFFMPADTGANFDAINLESFTITYPRAFVAHQGRLQFNASGPAFKISGFEQAEIVAYRIEGNTPFRLLNISTQFENEAFAVSFAGTSQTSSYWVSTNNNMLRPTTAVARPSVDITSGNADYIMISHPNFIAGLNPLIERRTTQGYSIKVVDVFDIYAQFSHEIFDPLAIRAYIAHAYKNMGTRYILLVGGDSYDYKNYLGLGQSSFIPTLYTATDQFARFAPVDPLYTDVNGNNQPDLAIGRFPVRDATQLNAIIAKTLAYEQKDYQYQTVFSSDVYFSRYSDAWATTLNTDWNTDFANLDQMTIADARNLLFQRINTGATLVNYFGHSSPIAWTYKGLLNINDIPNLQNTGKPFVVAQYGCWNTYFVNPRQESLGQLFLMTENRGAAAVLGSTTNNYLHSQNYLGQYLTPKLATPGMTIGQALLSAKQEMAAAMPAFLEIGLGWSILGDPTLVLEPN
jgi:hypothetical protein